MRRTLVLSTLFLAAASGLTAQAAAPDSHPTAKSATPATAMHAPAKTTPTPAATSKAKEKSVPATKAAHTKLLDLNSATRDELVALPGIGTAYADAIIKGRPYKSRGELVSRKIIPESAYKQVRTRVTAKHSS